MDLAKLDNWILAERKIQTDFSGAYDKIATHLEFKMIKKQIKNIDEVIVLKMDISVKNPGFSEEWIKTNLQLGKYIKILHDRIKQTIVKAKKIAEFLRPLGSPLNKKQALQLLDILEDELYEIIKEYRNIHNYEPTIVVQDGLEATRNNLVRYYEYGFEAGVLKNKIKAVKVLIKKVQDICLDYDEAIKNRNPNVALPDPIGAYNTHISNNSQGVRSITTHLFTPREYLNTLRKGKFDSVEGWEQVTGDNFLERFPNKTDSPSSYADLLNITKTSARFIELLTPYANPGDGGMLRYDEFNNADPKIILVVNEKLKTLNNILILLVSKMSNIL